MQCNCFDCPLYKEDFERKVWLLKQHGIVLDDYNFVYDVWCDKLGGKGGWYGYCEDAFDKDIKPSHKANKKRLSKRTRRERYNKRLKYLYEFSNYPNPSILITEKWDKELRDYISLDKPYYKRCYIGSRTKYFKRYSNKKVRRYKGELSNGNNYRKVFDYWWNVI